MQPSSDSLISCHTPLFQDARPQKDSNEKWESDSYSSDYYSELDAFAQEDQSKTCTLVSSPIVIDFSYYSDDDREDSGKISHPANTSLDELVNAVLLSPQEPGSYESPDAVSVCSLEDGIFFNEKNNDETELKMNKIEGTFEDVKPTEDEIEQLAERGVCSMEDPPLLNCKRNGLPLFVSSFDYHHKSIKNEVVSECIINQHTRYYEHSPARSYSSHSSGTTSGSDRSKHRNEYSPRSKRHSSHSTSKSTRHRDHKSRHSSRLRSYTNTTRYYNHYAPFDNHDRSSFYKPNNGRYSKKRALTFEGFPISNMPNARCKKPREADSDTLETTTSVIDISPPSKMMTSYKCPECAYTASLGRVITHYCFSHFTITCPSCEKEVEEPFFLQHCKHCKSIKSKLECPNCPLSCTSSSLLSLAMHIMCTHPTKKCIACEENFIPNKFIEHAKICFFGPKHQYTCPFCENSVAATRFTEHVVSHPIAECPLCFSDIVYQDAEQHMEACYLEKLNDSEESFSVSVFNCPLCPHRLTFENMSHHIVLKHISLNCVFCYAVMSHDQMKEHVLLCCQQHQNKGDDPKE